MVSPDSYLPGLDGIRALAVVAVVGYHLGFADLAGGFLGVGVFFTLSGFLITRILMSSWQATGTLELKRFWLHRARRLLPALLTVLTVVGLWTLLSQPEQMPSRARETVGALLYVSNWTTIMAGQSYFDRFAFPGPLDHMWSLAVEEQFYLLWPLILLGALAFLKLSRRRLFLGTVVLSMASFALLAALASPGFDNTRAYQGTDTRAGGILVGVALALAWPTVEGWASRSGSVRVLIQMLGLLGLVGIVVLNSIATIYSISIYRGGLLVLTLCTTALIAACAVPGGLIGRVLGQQPLRWLGERSYGIYLWHMPVIASIAGTALVARPTFWSAVVIGSTLALAELSWRVIEDPIRRHGFRGAIGKLEPSFLPFAPVGVAAVTAWGTLSLVACSAAAPMPSEVASTSAALPGSIDAGALATRASQSSTPIATPTERPEPVLKNGVPQTSCESVVHIGSSTSLGLDNVTQLPNPSARLTNQFHRVGIREVRTDILGARSTVERWNGQPNAQDAMNSQLARGYRGCWSIAMGTNDAANRAVGSAITIPQRIDFLMRKSHGRPVLWLTERTLRSTGPYADANMIGYNKKLVEACRRYPNLRIYDWRAEAKSAWFLSDSIHYNSIGNAQRAKRIAAAFAQAFPAEQDPSGDCVVRSGLGK